MPRPIVPALLCLALPLAAQNVGIALSNVVDGYVDVAYTPQLVPQSGITVEAWITYDESTIGPSWRYPTVVRQGHTTGGSEDYFLRIESGNSVARVLRWKVVTTSGASVAVNWPFAPGQLLTWTHVAGTYDGQTCALYVDGALVASSNGNGLPIRDLNGESLRIGKGSDVGTPMEVWNGEIDEVRIWPFARTQAEILQTKDRALASIPGLVMTWNLDNHLVDTSSGLLATSSGQVTFTPNPLSLTALPTPAGAAVGASTPGCLGPLMTSFGSLPLAGNAAFAPVCTPAPGNAVTFLAMGFTTVSTPLTVGGVAFWLDSSLSFLTLASTDGLGTARYAVPLPGWLAPGTNLAFQYGFVDPCGPQGITASDALLVITQ